MEIATTVTPVAFQAYHKSTLDLAGAYHDLYTRLGESCQSSTGFHKILAITPSLDALAKWLDDQADKIQALSCNFIGYSDIEDLLNEIVAKKRGQHIQRGHFSATNEHLLVQNVVSMAAVGWHSLTKEAAKIQTLLCPQAFLAVESYRQIIRTWPTPGQLIDGIEIERRMAEKVIGPRSGDQTLVSVEKSHIELSATSEWLFARNGDGYSIRAFGAEGHFKQLRGLDHLALLIAHPGEDIDMMSLVADADALTEAGTLPRAIGFIPTEPLDPQDFKEMAGRSARVNMLHQGRTIRRNSGYQRILDRQGVNSFHKHLKALESQIKQAQKENALGKVNELTKEKEKMEEHWKRSTSHLGKLRDLDNPYNKLRPRVHNALQRAYKKLIDADPSMAKLAEHFEGSVSQKDATQFQYLPNPVLPWNLGVSPNSFCSVFSKELRKT